LTKSQPFAERIKDETALKSGDEKLALLLLVWGGCIPLLLAPVVLLLAGIARLIP